MRFYKDKQGLPCINLDKSSKEAALLLFKQHRMNSGTKEMATEGTGLIQTVCGNYEDYT